MMYCYTTKRDDYSNLIILETLYVRTLTNVLFEMFLNICTVLSFQKIQGDQTRTIVPVCLISSIN